MKKTLVSFDDFMILIEEENEMPPGIERQDVINFFRDVYSCSEKEVLNRGYEVYSEFEKVILPALESCRYQIKNYKREPVFPSKKITTLF